MSVSPAKKFPYCSVFWKTLCFLNVRLQNFHRFSSLLLLQSLLLSATIASNHRAPLWCPVRERVNEMSEEFGPTFITVTDEDGKELVLEFVDALEYNGQMYQAFFPAETEGEDEDDPDNGLVILKVIHEDGEDLLSTLDSDEELEAVYEQFMELLFDDEEE